MNQQNRRLQYNYAQIDTTTGKCIDVFTASDYIPFPDEYILIPEFNIAYRNKYYHEGFWYEDSEFMVLAEGLN